MSTPANKPYPASRIKQDFTIGNSRRLTYYDRKGLVAAFIKHAQWKQVAGRVVIEFNGVRLN